MPGMPTWTGLKWAAKPMKGDMMNADLPKAYIKHQLAGRVRIKIPQKQSDDAYFERVGKMIARCDAVTRVQKNPASASLLIQHGSAPFVEIAEFAKNAGLFRLVETKPDNGEVDLPMTDPLSVASLSSLGVAYFDEKLSQLSAGRVDVRSVLFLGFMGLAIHQAAKGHFMSPASTFFWRALDLLNSKNEKMFKSSIDVDTFAE